MLGCNNLVTARGLVHIAEVVTSPLHAFDKMVEKVKDGEEPLYRPRGWNEVERVKGRRAKKGVCFKRGDQGNESVVFVPATPGSRE